MLKLLIVDDEPFFLDFIQEFLKKQEVECEIVAAVPDGLKALNVLKAQTQSVDVILTDIKMPVMDGLELICSAMELYPGYQFVVLSSYSDFHMVGEAFKLGAKEYALKSEITSAQMGEILRKCEERKRQQLLEEQKNQEQKRRFSELCMQVNSLQSVIDSSRTLMKKDFFSAAISRALAISELYREKNASLFLPEKAPAVMVMVKINDYYRIVRNTWNNDQATFELALTNILEEICMDFPNTVQFCHHPDEYLLFTSSEKDPSALRFKLHDLYERIRTALQQALLIDTMISTSALDGEGDPTTYQMYTQAQYANDCFFLLGKERLLSEQLTSSPNAEDYEGRNGEEIIAQFSQMLSLKNIKGLVEHISHYQISPDKVNPSQIHAVQNLFFRYSFYIREYAVVENNMERVKEQLLYYQEYLKTYGTLKEMNQWLEQIATTLLQLEYHSMGLVRRVKKYVLANYHNNLSLTGIAETMGVNPNYLSRIFSQEYGDSLVSYINSVRIQAASNMLQNTTLKNYEIAEKVGYRNVEHFSRIFKKITGKTPGEYKSEKPVL